MYITESPSDDLKASLSVLAHIVLLGLPARDTHPNDHTGRSNPLNLSCGYVKLLGHDRQHEGCV